MAEFQKIENDKQLVEWLKTQDARMIQMIAARASLRSLPAAMAMADREFGWIEGKGLVLSCLRATLISGGASTWPTPDMSRIQRAARSAAAAARSSRHVFSGSAASAASAATAAAKAASARTATSAARSAASAVSDAAAYKDSESGQTNGYLAVFGQRLWPDTTSVKSLLSEWDTFADLPDPDGLWTFWRDWYAGMLQGTPMDWEIQQQVALIEDAVWDAGPKAVAQEIAKIEKLYALEKEIARLKEQLSIAKAIEAAPNRLHNHPPEAVEEEVQVIRQEITLVWEEIEELEVELEKPEPSPEVLEKIAKALWVASLKITAYCAELSDIALKSTAKWSGPVGAAYLVTPDGLQRVSKLTSELTKLLVGG